MMKPLRVLMVEDSEDDALLVIRVLKKGGYEPVYQRVETAEAMRTALREMAWDVILCDYQMPKFTGLTAIALLKESNIDIPLIIVSGAIGEEIAVDCMRYGAHDYVMKGNLSRLVPAIERELKEAESRRQRRQTWKELKDYESELASIYENAPLIMILVDKEWTIRKTNAFTAQFVGRAMGDMINLRCGESLHCIHSLDAPEGCGFGPSCRECTLRRTAINTIETGQSHHDVEVSMFLSDGMKKRETIFLLSTAKLTIKGQSIALISMQDITERMRAEEALQESEARLAKGEKVAHLGYWDLDLKNQKLVWSKEVYRLFDKNPDTFVPTFETFSASIHPEDLGRLLCIRDEAMASHRDFTVDYRIVLSDGSFRYMREIVEINRNDQGNPTRIFGTVQDITEHKRVEEALRESEEKWRLLVSNSPDFIALHDREGRYLFLNHYSEGFMEKDVLGKNADEFILQESKDIYRTAFEKCIRTMTKQIAEYSAMGDYKKRRTYESAFIPIVRHGNEINVLVVAKDITERKQAEEALRRSEENFRTSLDDSPLGVRIVTVEGETIYANRAILDIYGYESAEELRTTPIGNRYTPESHAEFKMRREKRKEGADVPSEYTIDIIRKSGEVGHLQVFRKEILWDGERQFQAVYQDVTERKQVEEALQASEKRYRSLFENSIMGVSQANPDGRLIVVNNAYAQMYGYASAEEMMAEVPSVGQLYVNPEDRDEVLRILTEKGVMKPREMTVVRRNGTRFTVLVGAREITDPNGNLLYYQAEHIDITERKKVEEELRDSGSQLRALAIRLQQIREEERVLIAREIHDEMGGGLTGLKMDLSQLLHRIGDADPFEARPALMGKIHTANESIDQLIRVVRRISTDLRPSILDDLGLIAALEWQLSEFTSRTAIPHEFATTFDYVQLKEGTAVAVFRIFQEALTNVVRHSWATKVAVVLREGEKGFSGDESFVLEIRDNGRGIREEEILNPESLGLLGMKERVLAFGGELSIHGEPGRGTTLVLKIPPKQGEAP
jgi:PAS domain S-box-containing protein